VSGGFSGRAGGIIAGVIGLSFVGGLILSVFSDSFEKVSTDADSQSRSAIGHHLLRAYLEERGWEVEVSRARTFERVTLDSVLLMAEPRVEAEERERIEGLSDAVLNAGVALVILPKRRGWRSEGPEEHISGVALRAESYTETAFEIAGVSGEVTRFRESASDLRWTANDVGVQPLIDDIQLMRSHDLDPVIAADRGILLGRARSRGFGSVYVLSDPDVIATHGLARVENAHFVDRLLSYVREGEMPLIIDESCHEIAAPESIWRELLTFPLLLVTLTLALICAFLIWAAFGKWGRVHRLDFGRARGKHELIDNTAELLDLGRHAGHSLDRLQKFVQQDVAQALHAPSQLDRERRRQWIENAARSRGLRDELLAIEVEVESLVERRDSSNRGSVAIAKRLFRWKEMMIHGSRADSRGE
jgi:Domain of unknown function (DUF4350)